MATVEAPIATEHTQTVDVRQLATQVAVEPPKYTRCDSYKEAKYLAASRRRDGTHAYAVYAVALDCWCVRVSDAPQRYR